MPELAVVVANDEALVLRGRDGRGRLGQGALERLGRVSVQGVGGGDEVGPDGAPRTPEEERARIAAHRPSWG